MIESMKRKTPSDCNAHVKRARNSENVDENTLAMKDYEKAILLFFKHRVERHYGRKRMHESAEFDELCHTFALMEPYKILSQSCKEIYDRAQVLRHFASCIETYDKNSVRSFHKVRHAFMNAVEAYPEQHDMLTSVFKQVPRIRIVDVPKKSVVTGACSKKARRE